MTFHLLRNPEMLKKLQDELGNVMPEPDSQPKWNVLEQLPYLVRKPSIWHIFGRHFIGQIHDLTLL